MPSNITVDEHVPHLDVEHARLATLLKRKLNGIPAHHVPILHICDIIHKTPASLYFANIPPDIQLAFFLRNRTLIDRCAGQPIKSEKHQSLDTTRAIWYYRMDEAHQFQRYHDTVRWNIAIFIALLSLPSGNTETSPYKSTSPPSQRPQNDLPSKAAYIRPAARRFMRQYLAAVLEHHNEPGVFEQRDGFVKLWKSSNWDVFQLFGSGQKKLLKNEMKRLSKEWESELDYRTHRMGRDAYDVRVAKFVGSLIPGRKDQALPAAFLAQHMSIVPSLSEDTKKEVPSDVRMVEEGGRLPEGRLDVQNELLDALRVPLGEFGELQMDEKITTVADMRHSITALQKMRPRDILPMLMQMFPSTKPEH